MNLNNSNQFRLSRRASHIVRCGQRLVAIAALLGCLVFRASTACHAAPPVDPVLHLPEKTPAWLQPYRVRYLLQVPGDREKSTAASVIAQLPTGGWLKPDASDLAVQSAAGEVLPVTVLSHDPAGGTLIQFTRSGNDAWYWAYAVAAKPQPQTAKPFEEGLTFEVRRWDGEDISSWTAVREGLEESKNVIGNGVVAEVIQNCNPVRPNDPRRFAASYRGFLKVEKEGVYRFFVNAEDSAFLFIDGFKVIESVGVTKRLTGTIPTRSIGVEVELTAGLHPLEVHHVIGNNPTAIGYCTLMWMPPEAKNWNYVPTTAFVHADLARVADVETPQKKGASPFVYGIDDTLRSGDGNLVYLVRFEAVGPAADDKKLVWDFGDGTTGVGRSLLHVYFMAGDYDVKLQSGDLPAFHSNVHVWPAPCNSSPLSLSMALNSLATSDWKKFNVARVHEMFQFLMICELPDRWPLLDAVAAHLLAQPNLDPKLKVLLCSGRMEAMAHQGQAAEAVELGKKMLPEFDRIPSLKAGVELEIAKIYQRHLNQLNEASKLYESIVTQHRRVEHPNVRIAAIRWGDLYAEAGDLARAGECYRLAEDLGGETFKTTALTGAVTRGGLLRTAEQKLREGDIQQTSQLLERIEMNYPQQKLEGLYRLLRADADRQTGHYDEAMRNYAILLELKQWSGFHDRALHGIADTQFRQGNYAKALEWLSKLQRVFPEYFESEKLADYQKQIIRRQTKAANSENGAKFEDFIFNFDPQKVDPKAVFRNINLAPALGIDGADTGMSFTPPGSTHEVHTILPLQNLTGAQHYWVELWYREQLQAALVRNQLVYILKGSDKMNPGGGVIKLHLERTFGQWRKAGFLCSNSETPDGTLAFTYHYQNGLVDIDGISVRAVTDREADALNNFLKGSEAE